MQNSRFERKANCNTVVVVIAVLLILIVAAVVGLRVYEN